MPTYPIGTDRLYLRPFTADDFDAMLDLHSRPEVTRYLYWNPFDADRMRASLVDKIGRATLREEGAALNVAAVFKDGGALVGDMTLFWRHQAHRQGEIGFMIHPDHQGRGLASEASKALLRLGFNELGLHRVVGRCDARNTSSAKLMERLGMRREAHLVHNEIVKGEWTDELVFAMLEDEWRARSA